MFKKTNLLFLFLLATLAFACKKEVNVLPDNVFFNDFEGQFGYLPQVQRSKGHSGKCFYGFNPETEFSTTFMLPFKRITTKSFSKLAFNAFVYLPDQAASGSLVIQIYDTAGNRIGITQTDFNGESLGVRRWKEVRVELPLKGLYSPDNEIRCFAFNPNRVFYQLDDFKVEMVP
jgi:hypothetical protein